MTLVDSHGVLFVQTLFIPLNSLSANVNKDFGGLHALTQALARHIFRFEAGPGSGIWPNEVALIERGWQIDWYK